MVHVDVDVHHPLGALGEQPPDRHRDVVVDAEAAGPAGHRVVQPAGDVGGMADLALPDHPGGLEGGADDVARRLVHAGERRVVVGAEPQRRPDVGRVDARAADGLDQVGGVHGEQVGVGRMRRGDQGHRAVSHHAQLLRETHREVDPDRVHRVGGAEVVRR